MVTKKKQQPKHEVQQPKPAGKAPNKTEAAGEEQVQQPTKKKQKTPQGVEFTIINN
jgi:hypothetical protein